MVGQLDAGPRTRTWIAARVDGGHHLVPAGCARLDKVIAGWVVDADPRVEQLMPVKS
jgi:hypothetical protein